MDRSMNAAKRPLTIPALMASIAALAVITAAPRWSPALDVPTLIALALLVGFLIVRYVPPLPIGRATLDELLVLILGVVLAAGTVGTSPGRSHCGTVAAPGALSAQYRDALHPAASPR